MYKIFLFFVILGTMSLLGMIFSENQASLPEDMYAWSSLLLLVSVGGMGLVGFVGLVSWIAGVFHKRKVNRLLRRVMYQR